MPEPEKEPVRREATWEFAAGDSAGVARPGARDGIRDVPAGAVPRAESLPPELRVPTPNPAGRRGEPLAERIVELPRPEPGAAAPKPPISGAPAAP